MMMTMTMETTRTTMMMTFLQIHLTLELAMMMTTTIWTPTTRNRLFFSFLALFFKNLVVFFVMFLFSLVVDALYTGRQIRKIHFSKRIRRIQHDQPNVDFCCCFF
eukprot:PhF_6_TR10848/c0_g1_i2/m.17545